MQAVEELRQELIRKCGRSVSCIRAVEYYIQMVQNPCYPPDVRLTYDVRRHLFQIIQQHKPPRCDIKALVLGRLQGTYLEDLAAEAAEAAVKIKKRLGVASRTAAALAVYLVAHSKNRYVSLTYLSKLFNVSTTTISSNLKKAADIFVKND
jgi:hypothetical protein